MAVSIDSAHKVIEDRFTAAVNVIRGLPKNGSYQPSNDMMLRFYSYFKQATLGPCTQKKPPFWDVVGRAKYDSYKALGKMPRERAMELYVDELKKIIETMSYTENVAEFMDSVSELDGIDVDDLEAVAPEAIKKVRSQPNSPFASREASPIRAPLRNGIENGYVNGFTNGNGATHLQNGHSNTADHSDDEYIDTVEDDAHLLDEPPIRYSRSWTRGRYRGQSPDSPSVGHSNELKSAQNEVATLPSKNITQADLVPAVNQLLKLVDTMRTDVVQINSRVNLLERSLTELKNNQLRQKIGALRYPKWWPFAEISPTWFILMLLWPFVAQRLINAIRRKK